MKTRTARIVKRPYVALIGDVVSSRGLTPAKRQAAQKNFAVLMKHLNGKYAKNLIAKFVITLGDEFQAILSDPTIICDLIWDVQREFPYPVRLGFGYGTLVTAVPEYAINVDGPALHSARAAMERARKAKILGGVFVGFGESLDGVLGAIARLLEFHRQTRSEQQLKIMDLLRMGKPQLEIAKRFRVTPQAISDQARAAGWDAYREGEEAMRLVLKQVA
jgi:SatD family (SatD)